MTAATLFLALFVAATVRSIFCRNSLWIWCILVRLQAKSWGWWLPASNSVFCGAFVFASADSGQTEKESSGLAAWGGKPIVLLLRLWRQFGFMLTGTKANGPEKASFFRVRVADLIYRTREGHLAILDCNLGHWHVANQANQTQKRFKQVEKPRSLVASISIGWSGGLGEYCRCFDPHNAVVATLQWWPPAKWVGKGLGKGKSYQQVAVLNRAIV